VKTVYTSYLGSFGMGYTYFFNECVGLETVFTYNYNKTQNNILAQKTNKNWSIGFNVGLQIYLDKLK